ncbi:fimbrial protein [Pseudomonas sp. NFXW11]|uniref:fimbrial protein n=1 Tax=Pseudomonas sp. NFXW11 TaxID=2819531 RepID=UPI003CE6CD76
MFTTNAIKAFRGLVPILLISGLMLPGLSSAASCTGGNARYDDITSLNLRVVRDLPVGSVLQTVTFERPKSRFNCNGSPLELRVGFMGAEEKAGSEFPHVYKTGIPGVGLRIWWHNGFFMESPPIVRAMGPYAYDTIHHFTVDIVKIGPISSGHSRNMVVEIHYQDALTSRITFSNVNVQATIAGCAIARSVEPVDLLPVRQSEFRVPGTAAGPGKRFSIDLKCDKGVRVAYRIDALREGNIVKNSLGPGLARGVGIQLLHERNGSESEQALGTRTEFRSSATTVDGELLSLPLTARYFQLADKVTGGDVLANAMVTFLYE